MAQSPLVLSDNIFRIGLVDNLTNGVVTGAAVVLTLYDPNGGITLNGVVATEFPASSGVYRCEVPPAACPVDGTYTAQWDGTDIGGKKIQIRDLVQVTRS